MYEQRGTELLTRLEFGVRILQHFVIASVIIGMALGAGVAGYHFVAGLPWVDSLLEASMILGGMGAIHPLHSTAAKLFASFYALFSGLVFIGVAAIMFAPFVHRILHHFHWEEAAPNT